MSIVRVKLKVIILYDFPVPLQLSPHKTQQFAFLVSTPTPKWTMGVSGIPLVDSSKTKAQIISLGAP